MNPEPSGEVVYAEDNDLDLFADVDPVETFHRVEWNIGADQDEDSELDAGGMTVDDEDQEEERTE